MKKSVKKNYAYNVIYQIVKVIVPILTAPYLSRILGSEGLGIYGFTISIVTYFILIGGMGINLYGQREVAFVQDDKKKRSTVFWELMTIKTITMTISMAAFFLIFCINGEYRWYYTILLLEMLANLIDTAWFFQGLEEFKKTATRNTIVKLLGVATIFLFVKSSDDVWIYLMIYAASSVFGSLVMVPSLKKRISFEHNLNIKKHFLPVMALFLPQIAVQIYTVLDKTMIGWMCNDMSEVGYYEQSQKIIKILLALITSLGTVMMPRIANCFAEKNFEKIRQYMNKTFRFVLMMAMPLMFGLIAVSSRFVPIFFGDGYDKVVPIMQIMSAVVLFIGLSNILGTQYLLPTKRQREYTTSIIAGAVINIILNLVFVVLWQSIGAAVTTVVAEFGVFVIQLWFVRKDIDVGFVFKLIFRYFMYGLAMFAVCYGVGVVLPKTVVGLIAQVVIGTIVYGAIILISNDPMVDEIKKIIKKKK